MNDEEWEIIVNTCDEQSKSTMRKCPPYKFYRFKSRLDNNRDGKCIILRYVGYNNVHKRLMDIYCYNNKEIVDHVGTYQLIEYNDED